MKVITLSEIPNILDVTLQSVRDGKGFKNIMFLGNQASGRDSVIRSWLEKHPEVTYLEDGGYGDIESRARRLASGQKLLYQRRANCVEDHYAKENMEILGKRKYTTRRGEVLDLSGIPLVIATAFNPEYFDHITRYNEELMQLYDVYKVEPSLNEVVNYLRELVEKQIPDLQSDCNDPSLEDEAKEFSRESLELYRKSLKIFDLLKDAKASFSGKITPWDFERVTIGGGNIKAWLDSLCSDSSVYQYVFGSRPCVEADMPLIKELRKAVGMEELME